MAMNEDEEIKLLEKDMNDLKDVMGLVQKETAEQGDSLDHLTNMFAQTEERTAETTQLLQKQEEAKADSTYWKIAVGVGAGVMAMTAALAGALTLARIKKHI